MAFAASKPGRRRLCQLTCAALLSPIGLIACGDRAAQRFQLGQAFPTTALVSLTGDGVLSPAAMRDKALVVNFWATWCEPCRKEMSSLERLHQLANPAKLRVIGLSVDTDLNLAREFLLQHKLTFANFADNEQKLARGLLGIQAFPATFLVGADGTVKAKVTGSRDWSSPDTLRLLNQILAASVAAE